MTTPIHHVSGLLPKEIMPEKSKRFIVSVLFFLSGCISLILQVVWLKKLVLVFGNTVWAVSTLLTAFMAGLSLGSWLFGRIADRISSPLKLYGWLEGGIGLYGLFSLFLFRQLPVVYVPLYQISGGDTSVMGIFKFLLALVMLVIPTTCMGGTLPLLSRHFTRDVTAAGTSIGALYTINTFGAVCGTFISGFVLIPVYGLRMTVLIALGLSLIILIVVSWLTQGESLNMGFAGLFSFNVQPLRSSWIVWVYLVCGFAALSYEVIWNRILVLHLDSSVYAYSIMLTVYLLGITLGAAIMSHYVARISRPILVLCLIQIALALNVLFQIKQFSALPETLQAIRVFVGIGGFGTYSYALHVLSYILGVLQLFILPTVLFGASFPLIVRLFVTTQTAIGQEIGVLYAFNTIGNIVGSFCAGFLLLPLFGAQRGLLLTASLNLLVGLYLFSKIKLPALNKVVVMVGVAALFYGGYIALTEPNEVLLTVGVFRGQDGQPLKPLVFKEDVYATVVVVERTEGRGTWKDLSMNGVNVAGTSAELFAIQKLQGHLPLLLHHNPKTVLHIGFGSGGTAYSVSRYPVENITIAEISRSIIETSSKYFPETNHGVLADPRVEVVFTDGRNKVLADQQKYDVILSDSIHPRFSGNGSLYTYEYYKILRERLNPGGLVSQWLPFYSLTPENFKMIINSFYAVFPNTSIWFPNSTINAYVIVIGTLDAPLIDYARMEAALKRPEVSADLQEIDTATPYKLLDYFLFANEQVGEFVGDVPMHTDDNMAVEYLSGKSLSKWFTSYSNYVNLLAYRTSVQAYLTNLENASEPRQAIMDTLTRYEQATTLNLTGQRLFLEGKNSEAFAQFDQIPALNPDDLEPVEYFGASYQMPFLRNAAVSKD